MSLCFPSPYEQSAWHLFLPKEWEGLLYFQLEMQYNMKLRKMQNEYRWYPISISDMIFIVFSVIIEMNILYTRRIHHGTTKCLEELHKERVKGS